MNIRISTVALLLVSTAILVAAEPSSDPKLPADAQRALDAFIAAEAKIKAEADAKVAVERTKLIKALEAAKVAATKAGKLEEALAIKAVQEKNAPPDPMGVQGPAKQSNLYVGKWRIASNGRSLTINADMTMVDSLGEPGTYVINSDGSLVMSWKNGWSDTFTDVTKNKMVGTGKNGSPQSLTRSE